MATPDVARIGTAIGQYLNDAATLITTRVAELADAAIRHRPPWMLALGHPTDNLAHEHQWQGHVAIIAAYREQFKVTTSDPRRILGPYPEPGHPGSKAYWQAAESVLAARRLAGTDPAPETTTPDAQVQAQLATDVYRALPEGERAAISREMASRLGGMWFGNHAEPDEDAAIQPVHAAALTRTLTEHGHMGTRSEPAARRTPEIDEPREADLYRRGRLARTSRSAPKRQPAPSPSQLIPRPDHDTPVAGNIQPRH
jgi:hypothetical protein